MKNASIKIERHYATAPAEDDTLLCPNCCSGNLHHTGVTTFTRFVEDGTVFRTRLFPGEKPEIRAVDKGSPSERRSGLIVEMWCECCEADIYLNLAQHKGATRLWFGVDNKSKYLIKTRPEARFL